MPSRRFTEPSIAGGHFDFPPKAAGTLRRLLFEQVRAISLAPPQPTGARHLETLGRAPVCFLLWHLLASLV